MRIEPLDASRAEALERLLIEPSLSAQYETMARPGGVSEELTYAHLDHDATGLAYLEGELAGFVMAFVLPIPGDARPPRHWAMFWLGVGERFRRRGIGTALLVRATESVARPGSPRPVDEITFSAWLPAEGAEALAAGHGFRVARHFWLMERPLGPTAPLAWPAGLTTRAFDGSERALEDLTAVYNDSFGEHYRYVPGSLEDTRDVASGDLFRPDGVMLAYRSERCVGFCRCTVFPARGEIAMLGTSRSARGIGLGRSLLRWGVGWLEAQGAARVTLVVDGENESALSLYRQEGFEVVRTRRIWCHGV